MSLHTDALAKELGLADASLLHVYGPSIPISEESLGHLNAVMGACCFGKAEYGPERCTCWVPVFDLTQAPCVGEGVETRERCCHDCAYRLGSPERDGGFTEEALLELPGQERSVFACHQGMRRVIRWQHPCGIEIPAGEGDYRPPVVDGVAFKADGTPAELCAGWAALR